MVALFGFDIYVRVRFVGTRLQKGGVLGGGVAVIIRASARNDNFKDKF